MSNDPVRTSVHTDEGTLSFQRYFVQRQCQPKVSGFEFEGIDRATPHPDFVRALNDPALVGIIICPSNPFVSIDPIVRLPEIREAIRDASAPVIAVSPIVSGRALKGPAAKMLEELGQPVSATGIARHYKKYIDCFVIDGVDDLIAGEIEAQGISSRIANTVMKNSDD